MVPKQICMVELTQGRDKKVLWIPYPVQEGSLVSIKGLTGEFKITGVFSVQNLYEVKK